MTNIYDYQNNPEGRRIRGGSYMKSCLTVKKENVFDKTWNEKLGESQSLTPQVSLNSRVNTTHLKNSKSINSFNFSKNVINSNNEKDKNKIKKMFSGLGHQMKNAINVFGEVKEQIKYTANEAKKNINNYPFCTAPCNIDNLKNSIFINEGEIVIKKDIYGSLFKKKNDREENNKKKKENEKDKNKDIFTCNKNDILIKGNYNFGFHVELESENDGNKIIVYAYDKETNKKIPCSYKWRRVMMNKQMASYQSAEQYKMHYRRNNNIYENEYELTCEDIGYKICVECSCINNEQLNIDTFSKISINNFDSSENDIYNGQKYTNSTEDNFNYENMKHNIINNRNEINGKFESKTTVDSFIHQKGITSETLNDINVSMKASSSSINGVNGMMKNASEIFSSSYKNNNQNKSNSFNNVKYFGVAEAEIGPFTLNEKTKKMLEIIINNDTIRYPIYIIKNVVGEKSENEFSEIENVKNVNHNHTKNYYINNYDGMDNNTLEGFNNFRIDRNEYCDNDSYVNSDASDSMFSTSIKNSAINGNGTENELHMLYIYKNEIKIIGQNNKEKNMCCYKFQNIYPYIEFLENSYFFNLYVRPKEYLLCKCLYKRHRDLITILLRYMHANLYIINDYIFNNINNNLEGTKISDICESVNLTYILESIKKELTLNQKLNHKFMMKINSLQKEKNSLEEELKSTIEAFQMQLDDVKRLNDDKDLVSANTRLMKEVNILQQKFKDVDSFFKNKYKVLVDEIEKYKKLAEENKRNDNSDYINQILRKVETLEKEKNDILNKCAELNNCLSEEQRQKIEAEKKVEKLNAEINYLMNSLKTEQAKGLKSEEYLKEIEELKENNIVLQQLNRKSTNEMNLLTTEKNRLTKLVNSLTKDVEKLKSLENMKKENNVITVKRTENEKMNNGTLLSSSPENENLLKEIQALKSENELLKTRIKKIAKINKF